MKETLVRLFWPILRHFEDGGAEDYYKKSHRIALIVIGAVFVILSLASGVSVYFSGELGGLIPVLVFLVGGAVVLVVGLLGSNAAVTRIWGRR